MKREFNPAWEKINPLLGGAMKVFFNPEANRVEVVEVAPEDLWQARPISPSSE